MLFVWCISCNNQPTTKETISADQSSFFMVPFREVQIERNIYQIKTEESTTLSYKTGSQIIIPKNAFVDQEGNLVKGTVDLTYREFHNPLDIYLSGVPMTYEDNGMETVFETAGMVEINATYQGKQVFPNEKNPIQIKLNSSQKGTEYNLYKLDSTTGKWTDIGKDKLEITNPSKELENLPKLPEPPRLSSPRSFSIGDDTGNFPALGEYENVLFEPFEQCAGFTSTEIKVKDLQDGTFEVTFISDVYGTYNEASCRCYLAFKAGADYSNGLKAYQNKYKSQIAKFQKLRDEIMIQNEIIRRVFEVKGFGYINCDSPQNYPQGAELTAKFQNKNGKSVYLTNLVLVEKGRNILFRCKRNIKFNPQKENILWGLTENNQLAYITSNEFSKIKQTQGDYTFTVNIHKETLKRYEDIEKLLFN
jgi:hypothetical protein